MAMAVTGWVAERQGAREEPGWVGKGWVGRGWEEEARGQQREVEAVTENCTNNNGTVESCSLDKSTNKNKPLTTNNSPGFPS